MNQQSKLAVLVACALLAASAKAQVDRCTALTFYGNAVNSGLCRNLSPAGQNLQVCELSAGQPDIHLTFSNAAIGDVSLHFTVTNQAGCVADVGVACNAANTASGFTAALLAGRITQALNGGYQGACAHAPACP